LFKFLYQLEVDEDGFDDGITNIWIDYSMNNSGDWTTYNLGEFNIAEICQVSSFFFSNILII
jgi:hypothetical protein